MDVTTCNHPEPDLCKKLGFHVVGRLLDIWHNRAEGLTAAQCEEYRQLWLKEAGQKLFDHPKTIKCNYLWKRVREDGKVKKRLCKT
jgi:hypothetical protein